jgi:glycerophosphoryl diester phosphodiesterase
LGFKPAVFSPNFQQLTQEDVQRCKQLGIRVIPWTVNETKDMQMLKAWGVDGLITDYPNRARQLGYTLRFEKGK